MDYSTQHHTYILAIPMDLTQYLAQPWLWDQIFDILNPLISPIHGIARIGAEQIIQGKWRIPLGRLYWKTQTWNQLQENYEHCEEKDKFYFTYFSAFFPNLTACVKENVTPKVTLHFTDHPSSQVSGILLSFREDYYHEIGEETIMQAINNLSELVHPMFRIKKYGSYAQRDPILNAWTESIQDTFPSSAIVFQDGRWTMNTLFKTWESF